MTYRAFLTHMMVCLLAWCLPVAGMGSPVVINEFVSSNGSVLADEDGDFEDWIELYNTGSDAAAISGFWLSDDPAEPQMWQFPPTIIPPDGYLVVWASGKDRRDSGGELHANFRISSSGEPLILSAPDGAIIDFVEAVEVPRDVSYGRVPGGADEWGYFKEPTPGGPNTTMAYAGLLPPPSFSRQGGFYTDGFDLLLEADDPGVTIVYTLDGSVPDAENLGGTTYRYKQNYPFEPNEPPGEFYEGRFRSHVYDAGITIRDVSGDPDRIAGRSTTYHSWPEFAPEGPVFKGTVVRARAVKEGYLPSDVVTQSYFVTPEGADRYSVTVLSLAIQEDHLYDYDDGLYVAGVDFDSWRQRFPTASIDQHRPANYRRRGRGAEYPLHMEIFEPGGLRVHAQELGWRMHGASSRFRPQKSFRLYARRDYDTRNEIAYRFFEDLRDRVDGTPIESFRRLILRNSGNDARRTRMRDAFLHRLLQPFGLDHQGYLPTVHFINGEFWGVINVRERIDVHYLSSHYKIATDDIAIVENRNLKAGTSQDLSDMSSLRIYITNNDMSDPEHYAHVNELMDVENFLRYNVGQIYINNTDWPGNNVNVWRKRTPEEGLGVPEHYDGRWRWIFFDLDFGFWGGLNDDTISFATDPSGPAWPNPPWSTAMLRNLLESPDFERRFITLMADHINTTFHPRRTERLVNDMHAVIADAVEEHEERWLDVIDSHPGPLRHFGRERPAIMRQHTMNYFGLSGMAEVTVTTPNPARGSFRVNTVVIDGDTPGIEDPENPYPWTGVYFQGVPVEVEALPAPGYRFAGWEGMEASTPVLTLDLMEDVALTALFEPREEAFLLHYWSFNDTEELLTPAYTYGDPTLSIHLGADTAIESGTGNGFAGENARRIDEAGSHLRLNNPLGSEIVLSLPTTGASDIVFQYETRRSGQGAGVQIVEYTTDGESYTLLGTVMVRNDDPLLHRFQFADIPEANDNPNFGVRIRFLQGVNGGGAGNNRFDNVTVEGVPVPGTLIPPIAAGTRGTQKAVKGAAHLAIPADDLFRAVEWLPLSCTAVSGDEGVVLASMEDGHLVLSPQGRGSTFVEVVADDGVHEPVVQRVPVLVYPAAHRLELGVYEFSSWDSEAPEGFYPKSMIFLQSDVTDPGVDTPLLYSYHVPHDDYHGDDDGTIGFPYNNTRRTRLNGLGEDGISFINTGRGRDLGGTLLAVDTRGVPEVRVDWTGGTVLRNEREYALRLQYRVGHTGPFEDVLEDGVPSVYTALEDGHSAAMGTVVLPSDAMDEAYVQLLWRYYHTGGDSGPRAEVRLDDIRVAPPLATLEVHCLPAQAASGGAAWSIDGGEAWHDSASEIPVPVGLRTVTFRPVYGWHEPANQTLQLSEGQTITLTGTYHLDQTVQGITGWIVE